MKLLHTVNNIRNEARYKQKIYEEFSKNQKAKQYLEIINMLNDIEDLKQFKENINIVIEANTKNIIIMNKYILIDMAHGNFYENKCTTDKTSYDSIEQLESYNLWLQEVALKIIDNKIESIIKNGGS